MDDRPVYELFYTNQALENVWKIEEYFEEDFSQKECKKFYKLLLTFENSVRVFPNLYPVTNSDHKIRMAVLSKELSTFYRVTNKQIVVLAIFDNRCDLSGWL